MDKLSNKSNADEKIFKALFEYDILMGVDPSRLFFDIIQIGAFNFIEVNNWKLK